MQTHQPKANKRIIVAMLCYIFCPIMVLVLFQNCGNKTHSADTIASLGTGDLITPDPKDDPKDDEYVRRIEANQIVANRILTANYFISIFGPDIETTAAAYIANQSGDFGSGNTIYDRVISSTPAECNAKKNIYKPCSTGDALKLDTPATIGSNIRREAYRIRTCHTAVKFRTLDALKKIDATATSTKLPAINDANLTKAFHLFYRARKAPTQEVLESLTIVSENQTKPLDKWKDVILSICLSPHWQVL